MSEKLGVIYWNTLYRADPSEQLEHLQKLETRLRVCSGVGAVLLCLSEVTKTDSEDGLFDYLNRDHTAVYRATSTLKAGVQEGVTVATRDVALTESVLGTEFTKLVAKRGFRNMKQRWYGVTSVGSLSIATSHLSTVKPSSQEIEHAVSMDLPDVYGGDFNTLVSREYVDKLVGRGMVKLQYPEMRSTVPITRQSSIGWELDHVLVSPELAANANLEIQESGPSNHRPLLFTIS